MVQTEDDNGGAGDSYFVRRGVHVDTSQETIDADRYGDEFYRFQDATPTGQCQKAEYAISGTDTAIIQYSGGTATSDVDHGLPIGTDFFGPDPSGGTGFMTGDGVQWMCGESEPGHFTAVNGFEETQGAVAWGLDQAGFPYTMARSYEYAWQGAVYTVTVCMTQNDVDTDGDGLPDLVDRDPDAAARAIDLGDPDGLPGTVVPAIWGGPSGLKGVASCPATDSSPTNPGISWSVEPRMEDADGDGVLDNRYIEGALSDELVPDQHLATNMTVCEDAGDASVSWTIDGIAYPDNACEITMVDSEGSYDVVAEYSGARAVETVTPEHLLVVGLGDSYGSGEGVPHRSGGKARWDQAACHRSRYAAQAQAALRLEKKQDSSAVTFVHLACSGATAVKGVVGPYPDPPGGGYQYTQVVEARTLTQGNRIDAVLLSLGGNDIGFADIITKCVLATTPCPRKLHEPTQEKLLGPLPQGYASVAACLGHDITGCPAGMTEGLGVQASEVFITEYPNLATKPSGAYCNHVLGGLDDEELKWATEVVQQGEVGETHTVRWYKEGEPRKFKLTVTAPGLNTRINGGMLPGWTPVPGVFDASFGHGYCAKDESWVVSMTQSLDTQGDKNGAFHPNRAGQKAYGVKIATAVVDELGL